MAPRFAGQQRALGSPLGALGVEGECAAPHAPAKPGAEAFRSPFPARTGSIGTRVAAAVAAFGGAAGRLAGTGSSGRAQRRSLGAGPGNRVRGRTGGWRWVSGAGRFWGV